ncbi:MAG TPA: 30S ribosomal protein S2 [Patescibacteria group bacterium]|nr:30S ribosomal protein S2 [Patescibacteria group bacterium]
MQEITLQALLEAGCHFGHKSERWHPKASQFIYTEKDGIHIIDLAKTKAGLEAAGEHIKSVVAGGGEVLFVGTKRQARGILQQEAEAVGAPYFSERWIGGFLTNWDQIRKNIEKINRMTDEQATGAWKKFPKHEQTKMARYLSRIKIYYGGVLHLMQVPAVLFVVDTRKEIAAVREAQRRVVPVVGVVDTNSDPTGIDYVIPANDDAVGSVTYIVHYIATAYQEGKDILNRRKEEEQVKNEELRVKAEEAKKKQDEDAKKVLSLKEEQKREAEKMAKKAAAAKVEVKKEAAPELAKPGVTKKAGK